jgi:hypothetical protein
VARWLNTVPADFDGGPGLYTYVGNRPITEVDPDGLKPFYIPTGPGPWTTGWSGGGWGFSQSEDSWAASLSKFGNFLSGTPMMTDYGPETGATQAMQTDTERINRGLADWVAKNAEARKKNPNCPLMKTKFYPDKNWGFSGGPFQAGTNPTKHFVGGYGIEFTPLPNGTLKVDIINHTTSKSLFYDLTNRANNNSGWGPLHTQIQHYHWEIRQPRLP